MKKQFGIVAIIMAIIVIITLGVSALCYKGETTTINVPNKDVITTTVEPTTTVELTTTTVQASLYVCDTYSSSEEYKFTSVDWTDGIERDIPWYEMVNAKIVMVWEINDMVMYDDFINDIALFNEYTHAGVRVEQQGYIAQQDEFIVPVVYEDIEGTFAWADMGLMFSVSNVFGIENVSIASAKLRIDDLGFNNWEYHTHIVLHEMGHLYGLDHTSEASGEQTDSIMSYESDYNFIGYMPGDIAGLQEVFCN